ncbi:MAG: hypothetical protein QM570_00120 [Planctomycetota bacterium]|nr:hypothetical protein [Planctomycetota bacterium]
MAKPPEPGPDWEEVAQRLDALPEEVQDTEAELKAAAGEGPGPDDTPALRCPAWDDDGAERLARVRRYAGDVEAGRRIRFVDRSRTLSGPERRTRAGAVDGSDGPGIVRQAGAGEEKTVVESVIQLW